MTTNNQSKNDTQSNTTIADRAGGLLQDGIDAVKNNPGTTAAVIGGVAAAAAAFVNKDKLVETAGTLRDKVSGSGNAGGSGKSGNKA